MSSSTTPTDTPSGTYLTADFVAALGTAAFVSPFVTTIDKSVVLAANGKAATVRENITKGWGELVRNPLKYMRRKEFRLVAGVYVLTFWAANAAQTFADDQRAEWDKTRALTAAPGKDNDDDEDRPWYHNAQTTRFLSTVMVNIPGSVMQDRMFTRWFGVGVRSVRFTSLGVFAIRDMITCATSFSLPMIVATALARSALVCGALAAATGNIPALTTTTTTQNKEEEVAAAAVAVTPEDEEVNVAVQQQLKPILTFCLPTVAQFFSSPLHLIGLDVYNRPAATVRERAAFIGRNYWRTTAARIGRIGPTFGLGSNLNSYLRNSVAAMETRSNVVVDFDGASRRRGILATQTQQQLQRRNSSCGCGGKN